MSWVLKRLREGIEIGGEYYELVDGLLIHKISKEDGRYIIKIIKWKEIEVVVDEDNETMYIRYWV